MNTDQLENIEILIAEMLRTVMLLDRINNPSQEEREAITEVFAKDTVSLVLTSILSEPELTLPTDKGFIFAEPCSFN